MHRPREGNDKSEAHAISSPRHSQPLPGRASVGHPGSGAPLPAGKRGYAVPGDHSKNSPATISMVTHGLSNVPNAPSPATSASEHESGSENRQQKTSEKATDPRRRPKLATVASREQLSSSVGTADADDAISLRDICVQLSDQLTNFGNKSVAALVKSESLKRLKAKWTEGVEAKRRAETMKDSTYIDYATRQENSSRKDFEESAKEEVRMKHEMYELANSAVLLLPTLIRAVVSEAQPSKSNVTDATNAEVNQIKDDLATHRSAAFGRIGEVLSQVSEEAQKLREEFTAALQAHAKQCQTSGTVELKNHLAEALRQLQIKSTPIFQACQATENKIDSAMAEIKKSDVDRQAEVNQLRTALHEVRQENSTLRQELDSLKSSSVSKDEFALFKEKFSKLQSAHASPAIAPSIVNHDQHPSRNETAILKMKAQIDSVESRHESLAPLVHMQKGTADLAHKRIDDAFKLIGSLEEQVKKPANNAAQAVLSPAASPQASNDSLQLHLKDIAALQNSLQLQMKEIAALQHSVKSLNSRYNNLSTDKLAQEIGRLLNPVSASVQEEIGQMKRHLNALQAQQTDTNSKVQQHSERVTKLEINTQKTADASAIFEQVFKRLTTCEVALDTLNAQVKKAAADNPDFEKHSKELDTLKNDLKQLEDTLEGAQEGAQKILESVNTITKRLDKAEKDVLEQNERQSRLTLKIDEDMNDRLVTVQERVDQNHEKLEGLDTTITTLTSNFEKAKKDIIAQQHATSTTANAACDQLLTMVNSIKEVETTQERMTTRLHDVDGIERAVQKLKDSLGENVGEAPTRRAPVRAPVSRTSSAPSPHLDVRNPTKIEPSDTIPPIPTGPRALSGTPGLKNNRSKRLPNSSSGPSTPSAKRRANSPANDIRGGKKSFASTPDSDGVILLSDDDAPPRLGSHPVTRRGPN